jgi:SulP family sulfate permease
MNLQTLKGDFFGGITAGVIALPLALAFGVASGAGAIAGLYGAIAVGFFAAIFGGTKTQISGPTGPMTVVATSIIALFHGDIQTIIFIFFLTGIFQIALGFLKVGRFIHFIPYPVISGFMSGIGIIIIILQINPIIGASQSGTILQIIANLGKSFSEFHYQNFLLGFIALAILFFTPKKIAQIFPPTLIALIVATLVSIYFDFDVQTIGVIPSSLPEIHIPSFNFTHLDVIIPYAVTLAILGTIDSLLTSLVADSMSKTKHNPNKELIGQGIGNAVAGLIGGIPGAGATMRTVVNIKNGGTTQLSGVIHSIFLMATVVGASSIVEKIPLAVLSGILIKVGIDILDYRLLKKIKTAPKYDLYVMLMVLFLTVFIDLITAVGVGITLSSLLLIHRISRKIEIDFHDIDEDHIANVDSQITCCTDNKIRIISIDGPFFFGSVNRIINRSADKLNTKVMIFNCQSVPFMDLSAIFAMEDIIENLQEQNCKTVMILHSDTMKNRLIKMGIGKLTGEENLFLDKNSAIEQSKKLLRGD